jgi:hypothetical protein
MRVRTLLCEYRSQDVLARLAKKKYQYGHQICMPVLVLNMLRTSTGRAPIASMDWIYPT